ncbi:uncharacterized protein LOC105831317 isoform X1 [Monomorium pharaonis]|uniref:uncharacterized protein LOC105831317 isoform X1 n=1 Tax=Monomorium pharaonis TaxID=307658 RepID=UPI00063F463A|nr:uncharacterized protein LOC105831317 isoform X1 [Monomorium pharaonis]
MYIKYFLLLKFFSLTTALSIYDDNTNKRVISSYVSNINSTTLYKRATDRSSDGSRVDFQIRNHQGPGTYIFGFDTGHGKNRQYKMEERRRDGSVKGRYGFYDAKGKLKVVSYIAGPTGDYEERHHETITYKPDI